MSEKASLLPTAPYEPRFVHGPPRFRHPNQHQSYFISTDYDYFNESRRHRYGGQSLGAAILVFLSFVLIELRDCNWSPGINLDKLQTMHVFIMVFAFALYLIGVSGAGDCLFKYKCLHIVGVLVVFTFALLMVWTTYEAAVSPCIKTFQAIPVDLSPASPNKNVIGHRDGLGLAVLIMDLFASFLLFSAAGHFFKRY